MTAFEGIAPSLLARFELLLRQPIIHMDAIHRGYTPALRLRLWLQDGSTVFIKMATTPLTADWLRQENSIYTMLDSPCLPRLINWEDGDERQGEYPCLVLEDLSSAYWPPPWSTRQVDQVLELLTGLGKLSVPGLPLLGDHVDQYQGWQLVAAEPAPFLSLQLASRQWLEKALPILLAIDMHETLQGRALVHGDVRSDNLCIDRDRVVLIDWNGACLGSPTFDLAFWLPSLQIEGGPSPESILPDAGPLTAIVSGYFAARAGLPIIPDAPRVREIQLKQLLSALPWTVRALGLPPLDGHRPDKLY